MPTVIIPPPYRGPTQGARRVDVEGETVGACLGAVERKYPGFLPHVLSPEGDVHRFVKLFHNGESLGADGLGVRVGPADEIEILAVIAGG
jgi:hypothetical protein